MDLRKIILWGRMDVLGQGVECFLGTHSDCEVIRIVEDEEALIETVKLGKPDIVILYQGNMHSDQLPIRLMQICPAMRVITLSLENNEAEVFNRNQVQVNTLSDLYAVLNGG